MDFGMRGGLMVGRVGRGIWFGRQLGGSLLRQGGEGMVKGWRSKMLFE